MIPLVTILLFLLDGIFFVNSQGQNADRGIFSQTAICNRNDPSSLRNECVKGNMIKLIPALKDGYAPLEIPSLDPLFINMAEIRINSPAISLRVKIRNTTIHGFTSSQIENVRSKVKDEKIYFLIDTFIPQISATASYKGQVNFNQLKFNPNGHMNVTITGIKVTLKLIGTIFKENDEEFINIKSFDALNINLTDFKSYFSGLLPDPEINAVIVELINQGWRDIYDPFVTGTKSSWSPIFLDIFNKAFKSMPFK